MVYRCAALAPLLVLSACDAFDAPPPPPPELPAAEANGPVLTDRALAVDEIRTSAGIRVLPAEKRFLVLSGHGVAAIAMLRAGETADAAAHLDRLLDADTASERQGFEAFDYEAAPFVTLRDHTLTPPPVTDIAATLLEAETRLAEVSSNIGLDRIDQILFLMDQCGESYATGVMDAAIQRPQAYQAAYGYAVMARQIARDIESAEELLLELEILVRMWPDEGPVDASAVAPEPAIGLQIARVRLAASIL